MSEEEEVEVRAERQFIDSVLSDDIVEAETAFKTSMAAKVGDTLELKRRDYAKTFVGSLPQIEEDDD